MSEVDWSKAPEGFNYAMTPGIRWDGDAEYIGIVEFAMREDDGLFDEHGSKFGVDQTGWVILAERPLPWSGEGLPPAGIVCEVKSLNGPLGEGSWGVAEILYSGRGAIVWRWQGVASFEFGANAGDVKCRPLRTPEQIAAEEQQKAIDTLREDTDFLLDQACAQAVLAAGYRKVEGGAA